MTDQEKQKIAEYRKLGYGYKQIARKMGLSPNSISAYCRRHQMQGEDIGARCENCGAPVNQIQGRKHKRFCSDKSRMAWWNSHQDQVKRKANYEITCAHCQKKFISYGNQSAI